MLLAQIITAILGVVASIMVALIAVITYQLFKEREFLRGFFGIILTAQGLALAFMLFSLCI